MREGGGWLIVEDSKKLVIAVKANGDGPKHLILETREAEMIDFEISKVAQDYLYILGRE